MDAELEREFNEIIARNGEYQEAIEIARCNSLGKFWITGGAVFRKLNQLLYGGGVENHDFDFISETPRRMLHVPKEWERRNNRYGYPKFVCGEKEIDFVPLEGVHYITMNGLEPTIENYLKGTLLTVQTIAYDVGEEKLIGDVGYRALIDRKVQVNNREQLEIYSEKAGVSPEEILVSKTKSLEFESVLDLI
jgi:hypothetical protein